MSLLADILFIVSNALFVPVLLLLVLLLGWTVYALGMFLRDWVKRRGARPLGHRLGSLEAAALVRLEKKQPLHATLAEFVLWLAKEPRSPLEAERFLDEEEARLGRQVDAVSLASKTGPMLGLAGTLIPLGPALAALGNGDLSQLSHNLIIAFTATVVGLAIGGPCFAMALVRRRWGSELLRDMEFVCRSHFASQNPQKEVGDETPSP